jgi:hypothetical protein
MTDDILEELINVFGNDLEIWTVNGITVTGYYLFCKSYVKYPLFDQIMTDKRGKEYDNTQIFYIRGGNYLVVKYHQPITPSEFIKRFKDVYRPHNVICELSEHGGSLFVIIKAYDEIMEFTISEDLKNCGFDIIDVVPFIIADAVVPDATP